MFAFNAGGGDFWWSSRPQSVHTHLPSTPIGAMKLPAQLSFYRIYSLHSKTATRLVFNIDIFGLENANATSTYSCIIYIIMHYTKYASIGPPVFLLLYIIHSQIHAIITPPKKQFLHYPSCLRNIVRSHLRPAQS